MNIDGKMNSLTSKNALEAKADEKVLFITSRANRDTRIHLGGGHADVSAPANTSYLMRLLSINCGRSSLKLAAGVVWMFSMTYFSHF